MAQTSTLLNMYPIVEVSWYDAGAPSQELHLCLGYSENTTQKTNRRGHALYYSWYREVHRGYWIAGRKDHTLLPAMVLLRGLGRK